MIIPEVILVYIVVLKKKYVLKIQMMVSMLSTEQYNKTSKQNYISQFISNLALPVVIVRASHSYRTAKPTAITQTTATLFFE